jgi:hypothetical protein
MLDPVQLAGAGRQVTDGDREARAIGEPLQLPLPEPEPRAGAPVGREIPLARSTSAMPPWPNACASVASRTRRDRSVDTGAKTACFNRGVEIFMDQRTT